MKKSDLLKLLEEFPDDQEIVYLTDDGEYVEFFDIMERNITLGRFKILGESFLKKYKPASYYDAEHLGDIQAVVLG